MGDWSSREGGKAQREKEPPVGFEPTTPAYYAGALPTRLERLVALDHAAP